MSVIDMDTMSAELRRDEGIMHFAYTDQFGIITIGVGRNIDKRGGKGISDDEIDFILLNDINDCIADIENEEWFKACDTDNRRRALINMRFQLGPSGLREFVHSLAFIAACKWNDAADHLQQSAWAHETPERAARVIAMIRNG